MKNNSLEREDIVTQIILLKAGELAFICEGEQIKGLCLPRCVAEALKSQEDVANAMIGLSRATHVQLNSSGRYCYSQVLADIIEVLKYSRLTVAIQIEPDGAVLYFFPNSQDTHYVILASDPLNGDLIKAGIALLPEGYDMLCDLLFANSFPTESSITLQVFTRNSEVPVRIQYCTREQLLPHLLDLCMQTGTLSHKERI